MKVSKEKLYEHQEDMGYPRVFGRVGILVNTCEHGEVQTTRLTPGIHLGGLKKNKEWKEL